MFACYALLELQSVGYNLAISFLTILSDVFRIDLA